MKRSIRMRIAESGGARFAAFPLRAAMVARYDGRLINQSFRWLLRSRETMNFTYELTALNREQLAWFVVACTGIRIARVRAWMAELSDDEALRDHLACRIASTPRRGVTDTKQPWGRRIGWYSLVRAMEPDHIVETGTHMGLGAVVIAAALLRNGHGKLTTIDIDDGAGHFIGGPWGEVVQRRLGNSTQVLAELDSVDMFLHDSLHTYEHERAELRAIAPRLTPRALLLSDNAHASPALAEFAEQTGRRYLFFKEIPSDHWWSGDGLGVAWTA